MNRWSVLAVERGLGPHAADWDRLNEHLFQCNPMLESRFVDALLRHFGDGSERLCIFHTAGVARSMCLLRQRGPGFWASFLPAQAQIGPALMETPDSVNLLFPGLPGIVGQIDFLCNDPAYGDLSGRGYPGRETRDHALTMEIRLTGDFEQYWAKRSRKLVQNMARHERRLQTDGVAVRWTQIDNAADIEAAVWRYATLESRGWKGKGRTAITIDNAQGRFYQDVMARFAGASQATVHELWLNERLAASRLAIHTGRTLVMLKTSYDEELSKYAPGRLLLRRVIQDAHERFPGGVIEFYTDADIDQLAWSTDRRWVRHVSLYRSAAAANLLMLARVTRHTLRWRTRSRQQHEPQVTAASVDSYRHPREFAPDVLELFESVCELGVESSVPWYQNLVDAVYRQHDGVRFYVLRHAGRAVAVLPTLIERRAKGSRLRALSNYYTALYAPIIAHELKPSALLPLVQALCAEHAPLSSLTFAPMDPRSRSYQHLLFALQTSGLATFPYFCFGNWFLARDMEWSVYLAGRDGKLRSTLKRKGKSFAADGGTIEIVVAGEGLERGIQAYLRVYASSWKTPEPFPEFVPSLIRTCSERGWLRLGVAWLHGDPIAAQIWIVAEGKANIYKLAYHESFAAYASGTLLTAALMQHVIDKDQVLEVDYLIGDDEYKKSWMGDRRERWGLIVYNPKTVSGFWGMAREMVSRALAPLRTRVRAIQKQIVLRLRLPPTGRQRVAQDRGEAR